MSKITPQRTAQDFQLFGGDYVEFTDLIAMLRAADELYHNGVESFIPDDVYDSAKQYAQFLDKNDPYFLGVGSDVRGGKVKLPYQMGSLDQIYVGDLEKWIANKNVHNQQIVVTNKMDGISALLVFNTNGELQIAYSRGNGIEGADITRHIRRIKTLPTIDTDLIVRAEIILSRSAFHELSSKHGIVSRGNTPYKNPRNMIAGLMNAETNNPIVYEYITIIAYDILNYQMSKSKQLSTLEQFFTVPTYTTFEGNELSDQILAQYLEEQRATEKFEIDGLVLDIDDKVLRSTLVGNDLNPGYAAKYKVADASNLAIATVIDVEWNVSKDGYLKPRVKIEPVELVGVTVQYATGFNAGFIALNGIGPGAIVKITRAGDVIPYLTEVVKPMTFEENE